MHCVIKIKGTPERQNRTDWLPPINSQGEVEKEVWEKERKGEAGKEGEERKGQGVKKHGEKQQRMPGRSVPTTLGLLIISFAQ